MADLMGKGETQPVFFSRVFIDFLIDTNALEILRQEAIDVNLLEQTENGDWYKSQF